jgi:hypothetical protein
MVPGLRRRRDPDADNVSDDLPDLTEDKKKQKSRRPPSMFAQANGDSGINVARYRISTTAIKGLAVRVVNRSVSGMLTSVDQFSHHEPSS